MNNTNINEINTNINEINSEYMIFNYNYLIKMTIKLLLSTIFSFILSFEREMHSHPGGICTHILVGYGSCLFTMISVNLRNTYMEEGADPARICAQIVSGMGFLGSATIFKSDNYVKGINTAANLWISAAVSMAIAVELWEFAFVTCLLTSIILLINNRYKTFKYGKKKNISPKNENMEKENKSNLSRDPLDAPYGDENKIGD